MLDSLEVQHDNPIGLLRSIRDHKVIATYPVHVLARLAGILCTGRKKLVSVKDVTDELRKALQGVAMVRLTPESVSWPAWLQHFRDAGVPAVADRYEGWGFMEQLAAWPPRSATGKSEGFPSASAPMQP